MSHHERLIACGFKKLPGLDPAYFDLHNAVGYYILFSEAMKCYYALYTINAKECTRSICEVLDGKKRDRAVELLNVLKGSVVEDWEVYFKSGALTKSTKQKSRQALAGYRCIRQGVSRLDPNQPMHVCFVQHRQFNYARLISLPINAQATEALGEYLRRWRTTIDQGLREGRITLVQYYKACAHHAQALKDWRENKFDNFGYGLLKTAGVFTRKQASDLTITKNHEYTQTYFHELFNQQADKKQHIALEG